VSRYTADSRDRVRDAVDMLAVVGAKVELTRKGVDSYFGCCPFHDERTASFHVRPDEKHYHCFGCSESGDPFDFVMQTEGLDFKGALESLADRFGVKLETEEESPEAAATRARRERLYSLLARVTTYYERYLWEAGEAAPAREYLLGRGLKEEVLREFRVGYSPQAWDRIVVASRHAGYSNDELIAAGVAQPKRDRPAELLDRFRARIMFPTSDSRGRVIGFGARTMGGEDRGPKYLNSAEGDLYHKRSVLYGISLARPVAAKAGSMVLAEGYTDVIALHQAGVRNAVGIMGTSLTKEQVAELVRSVTVLELCLDADSAGQEAMVRAAKLCADSGLELRVVPLPPGGDPADLIQSDGAQALTDRIATSVPYVVFEVRRILDRADLSSAEGKDRAIAELRPTLAPVPASVLRDELVRKIAGALELPEVRLVTLLGDAPGPGPGLYGGGAGLYAGGAGLYAGGGAEAGQARGAPLAAPRRAAISRGPQHERDFLAICVAAPDAGAEVLNRIDADQLITSDVLRRAARHLAQHLPDTTAEPSPDDPELLVALADLLDRAGRGRAVGAAEVEHARLVLERERLQREKKHRQAHGLPGLHRVSSELQAVEEARRAIVARLDRGG
jgi:DNA primase